MKRRLSSGSTMRSHRSSDGHLIPNARGPDCGCQSCRHVVWPVKTEDKTDGPICRQCFQLLSEGVPTTKPDGFCSDTCEQQYNKEMGEWGR